MFTKGRPFSNLHHTHPRGARGFSSGGVHFIYWREKKIEITFPERRKLNGKVMFSVSCPPPHQRLKIHSWVPNFSVVRLATLIIKIYYHHRDVLNTSPHKSFLSGFIISPLSLKCYQRPCADRRLQQKRANRCRRRRPNEQRRRPNLKVLPPPFPPYPRRMNST